MPSLHFQDHFNSQSREKQWFSTLIPFLFARLVLYDPSLQPIPHKGVSGAWAKGERNREERAARALLQVGLPCINKGQAHKTGEWEDLASGR